MVSQDHFTSAFLETLIFILAFDMGGIDWISLRHFVLYDMVYMGGAVSQSVERSTPGAEVSASIPAVAARSLLVGSVSV